MKKFPGFFPKKDSEKVIWLNQYGKKIVQLAQELGISEEKAAQQAGVAFRAVDVLNRLHKITNEHKALVAEKNLLVKEAEKEIGAMAAILKKTLSEASTAAQALGIIGGMQPVDKSELRPEIKVATVGMQVKISFKKKYAQGVAIYTRLRGEQEWNLLSTEVTSPYWDVRPLADPLKPEAREYRAICTENFRPVGHYCAITFAVLG